MAQSRNVLDATKIPLASPDWPEPVAVPHDLDDSIEEGARVRHPAFGLGTVVAVLPFAGRNDGAAEVDFDRCGSRQVQSSRLKIDA